MNYPTEAVAQGLTWVDWLIVAAMAAAVITGLARGFFRSAFSLAGLVIGLMVASWNYARGARILLPVIHNVEAADAVSFLVIAFVIMALMATIGVLLAKVFQKVGLGCVDRLLGAVFGLFEGALCVAVCILVAVAFYPQSEWLSQSRLPKYFFGALHVSTHVTPEKLAERVRKDLKQIESGSPSWIHEDPRK